jgi:hypothetical protein
MASNHVTTAAPVLLTCELTTVEKKRRNKERSSPFLFPIQITPIKVINIRIHLIKGCVGQFGILFETFCIILALGNEVYEGKSQNSFTAYCRVCVFVPVAGTALSP